MSREGCGGGVGDGAEVRDGGEGEEDEEGEGGPVGDVGEDAAGVLTSGEDIDGLPEAAVGADGLDEGEGEVAEGTAAGMGVERGCCGSRGPGGRCGRSWRRR
jgi:hypothetical protein